MKYSKISLSDFLSYFDFSYKVNKNNTFSLIDLQKANLTDIESDEFELNKCGIKNCIERMDAYIYDYTMRFLNENTAYEFWTIESVFDFIKNSKNNENIISEWCDFDILNAIKNPSYIRINHNYRYGKKIS